MGCRGESKSKTIDYQNKVLPNILSKGEVQKLLEVTKNVKNKTIKR